MSKLIIRFVLVTLALCILAGCASQKSYTTAPRSAVVLEDVPYYPQREFHCGPSSLAMLLGAAGVTVSPDDLAPHVYLPDRRGSLQVELIATIRTWGRIPYAISPTNAAIADELEAGRPVLVLQNLGLNILPVYHYAVVIGMLPSGKILLRSGKHKELEVDIDSFLSSWEKAGFWGIVALQPGELPVNPKKIDYLKAVRDFELAGHLTEAERGYSVALSLWPGDRTVLFALGNNQLTQKKYSRAVELFQKLVIGDTTDVAALNNLAETLSLQGCHAIALSYIDQGIVAAMRSNSPLVKLLQKTRRDIIKRFESKAFEIEKSCSA